LKGDRYELTHELLLHRSHHREDCKARENDLCKNAN
jgi:hypothetical protein